MRDVTPVLRARVARLFRRYDERLVRVLRARLGRYDWDLAEIIAAATWQLANTRVDQLRASDDEAFPWLADLARTAQTTHFREARSRMAGTDRARAYTLPGISDSEDTRVETPAPVIGGTSAPMGVAA